MQLRQTATRRLDALLVFNVLWLLLCASAAEGYLGFGLYCLGTAAMTLVGTLGLRLRRTWAPRILDLAVLLAMPLALFAMTFLLYLLVDLPAQRAIWGDMIALVTMVLLLPIGVGGVLNTFLLGFLRFGPADEIVWEAHAARRDFEHDMGMTTGDETELDFSEEHAQHHEAEQRARP